MSTRMLFLLLFPLITLTRCESSAVREIREKSNRDHDRLLAMRFPPRGISLSPPMTFIAADVFHAWYQVNNLSQVRYSLPPGYGIVVLGHCSDPQFSKDAMSCSEQVANLVRDAMSAEGYPRTKLLVRGAGTEPLDHPDPPENYASFRVERNSSE